MTDIKLFLSVLLFAAFSFSVCAQEDFSNWPAAKLKSAARNSARMGDTYTAIDYFEQYMAKKPEDYKSAFILGKLYQAARDYENALKWYKTAIKIDGEKIPKAYYYAGEMLMTQQKYETAGNSFKKFRKLYKDKKDASAFRKLSKAKMLGCDTAQAIIDSPVVVNIIHLDTTINKASVEFSPRFINDSVMIYASLKSDTSVYSVYEDDAETHIPARHFYSASKTMDEWKSIGKWDEKEFNIDSISTGNGAFSPDRKQFYFNKCHRNWKNEVICHIYVSDKKEGKWQTAKKLPEIINMKKHTATQPTIGTDSKTGRLMLYFASNRPEGKGGMDIWYASYNAKRKQWTSPRNCGSKVNTPGDEITPFYDMKTRTMYFSSNGKAGLGELDVYKLQGEKSKWTPEQNLRYPINSPFDDLYYTLHSNQEDGFIVSNRPGGVNLKHETCCDDIYSFRYNEVVHIDVKGLTYIIEDEALKEFMKTKFGTNSADSIAEADTIVYAEGAVVSLFLIDEETPSKVFIARDTTDSLGRYAFDLQADQKYVLEFDNFGRFNKSLDLSTEGVKKSKTFTMQNIGLNMLITKEPLVIKNIYYDFDKAILKSEAKYSIDTSLLVLLKENPQIVIEISSHTDSKGDDEYNKKLSQERAESVVKHLIRKGIDPKRLVAKGYGEEKPIAPNELPDGTDNPDGRQKNRRTEFKIIGSLDQYSEIIYEE